MKVKKIKGKKEIEKRKPIWWKNNYNYKKS